MADDQDVGAKITPEAVPAVLRRSEGGSSWSSAASPAGDAPTAAADARGQFSAQSQRIIQAIDEGLADDDCTQIDGYGPSKFSAQFEGVTQLLEGYAFSSTEEYLLWLKQMVDSANAVTTWANIQEARRGVLNTPGGGRLTIILPPTATNGATFSLRKHVVAHWTPLSFVENDTVSQNMMDFLRACVAARVNILLVGQIGSGKTTFLRSLADGFGDDEKIAVVEQVPEINLKKPLVVEYVYQPFVEGLDLASVLDDQLYNGIERLIVGEVHLAGITKMLEVMIVTEGSMSTYHAFSTEQAGERMKLALQIENQNVTSGTAMSFIKQAVELVVVLEMVGGKRRVTQITELDWRSSAGRETLGGSDLFRYGRELNDGKGGFETTGNPIDESGRIMLKASKYGVQFDPEWFIDKDKLAHWQKIARDES